MSGFARGACYIRPRNFCARPLRGFGLCFSAKLHRPQAHTCLRNLTARRSELSNPRMRKDPWAQSIRPHRGNCSRGRERHRSNPHPRGGKLRDKLEDSRNLSPIRGRKTSSERMGYNLTFARPVSDRVVGLGPHRSRSPTRSDDARPPYKRGGNRPTAVSGPPRRWRVEFELSQQRTPTYEAVCLEHIHSLF